MRGGDLDQKITLYSYNKATVAGDVKETYTAITPNVWGEVLTPRGSESFAASRVQARETIRVKLRYRADVITKWRLGWNGQIYNISAVDRSQRRKGELWVTAEVIGAQ